MVQGGGEPGGVGGGEPGGVGGGEVTGSAVGGGEVGGGVGGTGKLNVYSPSAWHMSPLGGSASTLMTALNWPPVQMSILPQDSTAVESGGQSGLTGTSSSTESKAPLTIKSATVIAMHTSPTLMIEMV